MHASQKNFISVAAFSYCLQFNRLLILIILSICFCFTKSNAVTKDYTIVKNSLMEKLDSIDVEKQIRKRKGLPLNDLEKQSMNLKDSIIAMRNVIEKPDKRTDMNNDDATDIKFKFKSYKKYLPRNAFDWAILSAGFAAVIAGIILFIGFVSIILKRLKIKKTSVPKIKQNINDQKNDTTTINNAAITGGINDIGIDSLRKRINEEREITVNEISTPAVEVQVPTVPELSGSDELKKNIIAASEKGAGISELSKRFHVSSDQVSLILRMAQREYGKK